MADNLLWHPGKLTLEQREKKLGQKGAILWFTGFSGSGKSSVAREVEVALLQGGRNAFVLDGDNLRLGLNNDLDFSAVARAENIRRVGELAKLMYEASVLCLTAFISPFREDRARVRSLVPEGRFIEVYCAATLAECEARDVKGLYKKARAGSVADFTGITSPYEAPEAAEIVLQTGGAQLVSESAVAVIRYLESKELA